MLDATACRVHVCVKRKASPKNKAAREPVIHSNAYIRQQKKETNATLPTKKLPAVRHPRGNERSNDWVLHSQHPKSTQVARHLTFMPARAKARRADCAPGPGVLVLFPPVARILMCRAVMPSSCGHVTQEATNIGAAASSKQAIAAAGSI